MKQFEVEKVTPFWRHETFRLLCESEAAARLCVENKEPCRPVAVRESEWVIPHARIEYAIELDDSVTPPSDMPAASSYRAYGSDTRKGSRASVLESKRLREADFIIDRFLYRLAGWLDMCNLLQGVAIAQDPVARDIAGNESNSAASTGRAPVAVVDQDALGDVAQITERIESTIHAVQAAGLDARSNRLLLLNATRVLTPLAAYLHNAGSPLASVLIGQVEDMREWLRNPMFADTAATGQTQVTNPEQASEIELHEGSDG